MFGTMFALSAASALHKFVEQPVDFAMQTEQSEIGSHQCVWALEPETSDLSIMGFSFWFGDC